MLYYRFALRIRGALVNATRSPAIVRFLQLAPYFVLRAKRSVYRDRVVINLTRRELILSNSAPSLFKIDGERS